jgi:hypothetical protein
MVQDDVVAQTTRRSSAAFVADRHFRTVEIFRPRRVTARVDHLHRGRALLLYRLAAGCPIVVLRHDVVVIHDEGRRCDASSRSSGRQRPPRPLGAHGRLGRRLDVAVGDRDDVAVRRPCRVGGSHGCRWAAIGAVGSGSDTRSNDGGADSEHDAPGELAEGAELPGYSGSSFASRALPPLAIGHGRSWRSDMRAVS